MLGFAIGVIAVLLIFGYFGLPILWWTIAAGLLTWYLGAIADVEGREPELLEDNNIRVGSSLAIGSTLAALHAPGFVAHD